jgi:hypothetical protein
VLDFYRRHPERCILLNINALLQSPHRLAELLETKLKLKLASNSVPDLREIYDDRLFKSVNLTHPVVQLLRRISPQYFYLLEELDRAADLPSDFSLEALEGEGVPAEIWPLLLHWQGLANQLEVQSISSRCQQEKAELQSQIEQLQLEIATMKMSKLWKLRSMLGKLFRNRVSSRNPVSGTTTDKE